MEDFENFHFKIKISYGRKNSNFACAEMIQIAYLRSNSNPVQMDFLRCTQVIHESKLFSAHISKYSTTGCFAPCAETPNLDQYIPQNWASLRVISIQFRVFF